ncbi:MAG: GGDEF domain-containing protein [Thermoleophilaceae bacterium]|nr:GGDEF domain-containing protein [Thermoleophilaceae bacterium]
MSSDATAADLLKLVGRVDRAATQVVSRWLAGVAGFGGGRPQSLADLGALAGRVAPSVLVNAHLMWRGTAIEVLDASGADARLAEQARTILADRCDAGLVAVSRQFDEPRDRLTGLANRSLLLERIEHALLAAARYVDSVGVIFIELDRAADAPDELVLEAADRLRRVARGSDTVARLAEGEFVICAERLRSDFEAVAIADRALIALRQPYTIDGEEVRVSPHAGIAVSSGGDGPETLLANASAARRAVLDR